MQPYSGYVTLCGETELRLGPNAVETRLEAGLENHESTNVTHINSNNQPRQGRNTGLK